MNSKNLKGKKAQNTKSEEQETQWTDMTENKTMEVEDKEESEEEYEVEIIVDKMIKKGAVFYKVKWKNYSLDDCTWEPEANLDNCPLKIRDYENQLLAKANTKPAETPKEVPKEAAKEVPIKPEIKAEEVKAEEPAPQEKKSIKKGTSNKPAAVNPSVEPESITGKRDRQQFDEEKAKAEDKTAKAKKEKSGKKKNEETADKDKTSQGKIINKSEAHPEADEESISKMRKLSPKGSGQPESQVTQTKDGSGNIKGINSGTETYPPPVKYASKDLSHQTTVEKQQIEKIYDEVFAKAKQGQPAGGKSATPSDQHPPSQTKGSNAKPEEKDSKANSTTKFMQAAPQEVNKGISLSKIMQDDKLMEMSETESRSEAQDEKKNQGSETSPFDDKSKSKKKARSEYGALEKGDIPLKVVGIRPVKEDKDLEIMISWKTREDGVKPYNSKVMRIDLLRSGFYMPLIEFYESKMKLEGAPAFDPGMLPKV